MAYRWFLGFGFHTEVPHFSTFVKIMNDAHLRNKTNHMLDAKKRLNVSLQMRRKSMVCDGQPYEVLKIVHAGDAYICCHEFKETSNLDLAGCLMMTSKTYSKQILADWSGRRLTPGGYSVQTRPRTERSEGGGSANAPRKASAWSGNQPFLHNIF
jgi:hypothetical protein